MTRISISSPLYLIFCLCIFTSVVAAKRLTHLSNPSKPAYKYGDSIPISCLNRTIDDGQHISDFQGALQYIPFETCNETGEPLALHYGVSETITCTVESLSDSLYHLLEYYVHSDAPLTCRMPTLPLIDTDTQQRIKQNEDATATTGKDGDTESGAKSTTPFTPLTISLQGTLQLSHLHMWTDMNVLLHRSYTRSPSSSSSLEKPRRGQIVAGTAYSFPLTVSPSQQKEKNKPSDVLNVPADPWAAGQGSKVVRGEPLTFTFRTGWIDQPDLLPFATRPPGVWRTLLGLFWKGVMFLMVGGVGAVVAIWWERTRGRGAKGGRWAGDGLLGSMPNSSRGLFGGGRGSSGSTGTKTNGYGGYGMGSGGGMSQGYGGYSIGKRD